MFSDRIPDASDAEDSELAMAVASAFPWVGTVRVRVADNPRQLETVIDGLLYEADRHGFPVISVDVKPYHDPGAGAMRFLVLMSCQMQDDEE